MNYHFEFPIIDNHIHINLDNGFGIEAIKIFEKYGGTHIFLVSLPSWCFNISIKKASDYKILFEKTIKTASLIKKNTNVEVYPIIGIHPMELLNLNEKYSIEKSADIILSGLEIASKYVAERKVFGLKSGRPHILIQNDLQNISNMILEKSLLTSKDLNCPLQIHDKDMSIKNIIELGTIIQKLNCKNNKIINHHALPYIHTCKLFNLYPSITAKIDNIETSIKKSSRFILETDYMDDKTRPGAVLGTKTIPKNIKKLIPIYGTDIFWKINKENIEDIYDIDIEF